MEFEKKLEILGKSARYDLSCACGAPTGRRRSPLDKWVYPAVLPNGKTSPILKVLLTNVCEKDCKYCENRSHRDFRRVTFKPGELAANFMELFRKGTVMGLFLSSGVSGSAVRVMDRMIATSEILRRRHAFRGYLHLKILPGVQEAQVERAGRLATRLSINLEVPDRKFLSAIAPGKDPDEIGKPLRWIRKYAQTASGFWAPSGFTTQFMVGAAGESDRDLVKTADLLYGKMDTRRVYYSAFQPVPDTPLENTPACSLTREHRLYQTDFLLRKYGFSFDEIIFNDQGNIREDEDPKTTWAKAQKDLFPVEINSAPLELLLRVPGIGPVTAGRIVKIRREAGIRGTEVLAKAGAIVARAAPYLLLGGRRVPHQLDLL